ncbi:TlpA family protein disulfide reductase [Flagellimonas sp. 2504JD4-2]
MKKLRLEYSFLLQGEFSPGKRNLLFVFQVNCPGCFFYGFPSVNNLFKKYSTQINFLGLSTAFEDFQFNSLENTKMLLEEKKLVGETKKAFETHPEEFQLSEIDFPVAMDVLSDKTFITQENIVYIGNHFANYGQAPEREREQFDYKIKDYLNRNPIIPVTFTLNQFQGTPTFVLFDEDQNILEHWFGHRPHEEIEYLIKKHLE